MSYDEARRKTLVCLSIDVELFRKNAFLDILEIFSLHMSPISSNLLKKTFSFHHHRGLGHFCSGMRRNKYFVLEQESDLPLQAFRFFIFLLFHVLIALSFYGSDWLSIGLASSPKMFQKASSGSFYQGAAECSCRKFSCEIFTQVSEHFRAYLRLHWANHPDLIGKILSSCRVRQFWLKVMTSEVEQRLTHVAGYGRHSSQ